MHYYKRNIGDYAKKAGRLSMLEHGAFTLLLDSCYDRERFPTLEEALEWTWARSPDEVAAVQFVLSRFFDFVDGVYVQNRIKEEIERFHQTSAINSRIATEREAKRTKRVNESTKRGQPVNGASTLEHEAPPNQEPLTTNQEPRTKKKTPHPPEGLDLQAWSDWVEYRREIRRPIRSASLAAAMQEMADMGSMQAAAVRQSIAKGWQGLFPPKQNGYQAAQNGAPVGGYHQHGFKPSKADLRLLEASPELASPSLKAWAAQNGHINGRMGAVIEMEATHVAARLA